MLARLLSLEQRMHFWGELAAVALLGMEVVWVSEWYCALIIWRQPWPWVALILGLVTASCHIFARLFEDYRYSLLARRLAFTAWLLVCAYGSSWLLLHGGQSIDLLTLLTRPIANLNAAEPGMLDFWHLFIAGLLAWRGASLAHAPIGPYNVIRSMQLGLLMFMFYGLINAPFEPPNQSLPALFIYLTLALVASASARLAILSELRGGRTRQVDRNWIVVIAASIVVVIGLALLVGQLSTGALFSVFKFIVFIFLLITTLISLIILLPLLLLLDGMVPWLKDLHISLPVLDFIRQIQEMVAGFTQQHALDANSPFNRLVRLGEPVIYGSILLGVLLLAILALRWRLRQSRLRPEEDAAGLPVIVRLPGLPELRLPWLERLRRARRLLAAARIRRIYANMMDLCARLGQPRPAAETPLEFLPTLEQIFTGSTAEVELITRAYLKIRYGELPETDEEVQAVIAAWETVKRQGKRLSAARRRNPPVG